VAAGTGGVGFELAVLTAVLLGGVALTGGVGSVFGVTLGVLFLGALQNGLTLLSVPTFYQQMAQGLALVVGAALAYLGPRLERLGRAPHPAAQPPASATPLPQPEGTPA
jgi:ribose/xylose/arabinose/galactoside ABC-type transport system permease subunit